MLKPISPDEVISQKAKDFPEEVIEVFNSLIAKKWSNGYACITLAEAKKAVVTALNQHNKSFCSDYMNVEDIFRAAGWEVVYDQPGYNESYEASYTFKKRRN